MKDNPLLDGQNDFIVCTPNCLEIVKSTGPDADKQRRIGGVCSTETLDRQDERVLAKGLDFSEFVRFGYFNDNHKQGTTDIVGHPDMAEIRAGRWYTEGILFSDWDTSTRIWQLAKVLSKSTDKRRLGFSIEGKVIERGLDNRILKAVIRHVAITNSPVNTDCTWDVVAKAFSTAENVEAVSVRTPRVERALFVGAADDATKLIKANRPEYSWATCERLAKYLLKQHERNQTNA